jgi:hypothetical protein
MMCRFRYKVGKGTFFLLQYQQLKIENFAKIFKFSRKCVQMPQVEYFKVLTIESISMQIYFIF